MELHRKEEQPPPQEPWGRLLRLGAEEDEPQILLWKREWTIGRRRGCDLSFPSNKLVSGDHCKLRVDEKSGEVTLEDTSTNGTVINKLQVVKKQSHPLRSGDIIYVVYRKNEPEHSKRGKLTRVDTLPRCCTKKPSSRGWKTPSERTWRRRHLHRKRQLRGFLV